MSDYCTLKGYKWGLDGTNRCTKKLYVCSWCSIVICKKHQEYMYPCYNRCHRCIAENQKIMSIEFGSFSQSARDNIESSIIAFYENTYLPTTKAARK